MRQFKISHSITNRNDLSLDKYLNDISKVQLITPEEEVELSVKISEGDENALNTLTQANLRFVVSVAKQYQHQGLPLTDLINEGNMGLMKAARRFDHTKGFRFISYAVWWIRQAIMQALVENARMVRLPLNKIGTINKISKALLLIFLAISLTACGSLGRKPQVDPVVIEHRTAGIPVFHPPLPDPIELNNVEWKVLTPEIMEQYIKDFKDGKEPVVVYYALTPEQYKALAEDMGILKRFIKEQKAIIQYYRDNMHEMMPPEKAKNPS